jgi:hypothetical protein
VSAVKATSALVYLELLICAGRLSLGALADFPVRITMGDGVIETGSNQDAIYLSV